MSDQAKMREILDNLAVQTIESAQRMLRENPNLSPTQCYRLAIAYSYEVLISVYQAQIDLAIRTWVEKQNNE